MNNHSRRLKEIELTLTPSQVVFLWMQKALIGNYQESLLDFKSPNAFVEVGNSVDSIVKTSMKGESQTFVERARLEARKEAFFLLLLLIETNHRVLNEFLGSKREYVFLVAYLLSTQQSQSLSSILEAILSSMTTVCRAVSSYEESLQEFATMHRTLSSISEKSLRMITLAFVQRILYLEEIVSRISAGHFGGRPILFANAAAGLAELLQLVDEALKGFNSLAAGLRFRQLNKEEIRDDLSSTTVRLLSQFVLGVRAEMLTMVGETRSAEESLMHLAADCSFASMPGRG